VKLDRGEKSVQVDMWFALKERKKYRSQTVIRMGSSQPGDQGGLDVDVKKVKVKADIALNVTPSQSYGTSLAVWDHTVLPATRHK